MNHYRMLDLEGMDVANINMKASEIRKELFQIRMKKKTVGLEKPHLVSVLRQNLARLLTVKSTKERKGSK